MCPYVPHGDQEDEPRMTEKRCLTKKREALRDSTERHFQTRKAKLQMGIDWFNVTPGDRSRSTGWMFRKGPM